MRARVGVCVCVSLCEGNEAVIDMGGGRVSSCDHGEGRHLIFTGTESPVPHTLGKELLAGCYSTSGKLSRSSLFSAR